MNEQDELIREIRARAERLPVRIPSPTNAMTTGRRRRRISLAVATLAALVIAVGVALPLRALMRLGEDAPPKPIGPPPAGAVPAPTGTIAFIGGRDALGPITLLDVASGSTEPLTKQSFSSVNVAWSPDGSMIATTNALGEGTGEIVLVSTKTGEPIRTLPIDPLLDPQDMDWSPDETFLAFTDNRGGLHTIEVDGSRIQDVPTDGRALDIAFSPQEDEIAFVGDKGDLKVVNLATRRTRVVFEDPPGQRVWFAPTWSPDGSKLAFSVIEENRSSINVVNADGTGLRQLVAPDVDGVNPSWSPDGNWIAFEGDGDRRDLSAVSVDGATIRQLTDTGLGEFGSDWGEAIPSAPSSSSASPTASLVAQFTPPTTTDGSTTTLPLVFPDGSQVELQYPADLRLAERGLAPNLLMHLDEGGKCGWDPIIGYLTLRGDVYDGDGPMFSVVGDASHVEVWEGAKGNLPQYLVIKAGFWEIAVPCPKSDVTEEASLWANHLRLTMSERGFLVATPTAPLVIEGPEAGTSYSGPEFYFLGGDATGIEGATGILTLGVATRCPEGEGVARDPGWARRCFESSAGAVIMTVQTEGNSRAEQDYIDAVIEGVEVTAIELA
jgi:WD40 repeat protein